MSPDDLEELEIDLLLEALDRRFGYDFRRYARASLRRRLENFCRESGHRRISELIAVALHDAGFLDRLINGISVSVTEPFRDPEAFAALRAHAFDWLRSHAYMKVWNAGCATGEEVYSLAILLDEAGLLERAQIYATDINTDALAVARAAVYPLDAVRRGEDNYRKAGGAGALSDYYTAQYGRAKFAQRLQDRIVFSQHNLATDAAFGEMQLILCRNVLIYFNRELQERVVGVFLHSLAKRGFLVLGAKEGLGLLESGRHFECLDARAKLFRGF